MFQRKCISCHLLHLVNRIDTFTRRILWKEFYMNISIIEEIINLSNVLVLMTYHYYVALT